MGRKKKSAFEIEDLPEKEVERFIKRGQQIQEPKRDQLSSTDTNSLAILQGRLNKLESIPPKDRRQPDYDFKHEGLLQRVHGLKKLYKTVK